MSRDSVSESPYYDLWEIRSDGTEEFQDLLTDYRLVFEVTGDGGLRDLVPMASSWLAQATPGDKRIYMFSDQDRYWLAPGYDTAYADTDPWPKYFGVKYFGPTDYPYQGVNVTWPWRISPTDTLSTYAAAVRQYMTRTNATFWYHPFYELPPFLNWMDAFHVTNDAFTQTIFEDGGKSIGVQKIASDNSWQTMYLAFDYLSCNFRSDTSKEEYSTPDKDPKYAKLSAAVSLMKYIQQNWTGVSRKAAAPEQFRLSQSYPNPFNPSTTIAFDIPFSAHVSLLVYDCLGREVATLVDATRPPGHYEEVYSASKIGSGVYFYRITAGSHSAVGKMIVVK
jgi:hypothetical protein